MNVGVTYSEPARQFWLNLDVPEGATVREAIERSGVLKQFPQIDLDVQKVGVFGKVVKPDVALRQGDRVEIYRAITCDPQTVPRKDGSESDD
jgi:hypothetical protein